jgi:hypothetical protein
VIPNKTLGVWICDLELDDDDHHHHGGNIFKYYEKAWMAEIMVKWLRNAWDRRSHALLKHSGMLVFRHFQGSLKE